MTTFQTLISTFTPTIFTWSYYTDFEKIKKNTFKIKLFLNILNSLLGEKIEIEDVCKIIEKGQNKKYKVGKKIISKK